MGRLSKHDVREILEILENELSIIRKLDRIEKMKMRSKIRKQGNWLLMFRNPTSEKIMNRLEEKLSDLFSVCPYGFSDKLKKVLKVKLARLQRM